MTAHTHSTSIVRVGDSFRGSCACRTKGPVVANRWEADDWNRGHLADIERVRLHLNTQPSLPRAAQLYREAAAREDVTPENAALFIQMAEEIEHRVGGVPTEQLQLFD